VVASCAGVLLAGVLLGVETWVVGLWLLARLVAATAITPRLLLGLGAGFALSVLVWVTAVVAIGIAVAA
jgi:hypothetical protein